MGKILNIVIVILILAALVYGYMQFTASSTPATPEGLSTSSGTPTGGAGTPTGGAGTPAIGTGAPLDTGLTTQTQQNDFVSLLLDLKQISLDTSFLTSSVFTSLTDYSHDIAPQTIGRRNPFAPIGTSGGIGEGSTQVSAFATPTPSHTPTNKKQTTPAPASAPASAPVISNTPSVTPTTPPVTVPPPPDQTPPPDEPFLNGGL